MLAVSAGGAVAFGDTALPTSTGDKGNLVAGSISAPVVPQSTESETTEPEVRGTVVSRSAVRTPVTDTAAPDVLKRVEAQVSEREDALAQDNVSAARRAATIEENQWVMPLEGYRISATFGEASYLWSTVHTGLDLSAPSGTPVKAVANGTITEASYDSSYGNMIVLTLEDGTEIWYCHLSAYEASVGDTVTGGEVIGLVGSTGNSTGAHLHIEVRPDGGSPVDPYSALVEHGVTP